MILAFAILIDDSKNFEKGNRKLAIGINELLQFKRAWKQVEIELENHKHIDNYSKAFQCLSGFYLAL